jgi:putative ABC transport system substrate-binding protein
MKARDAWWLVTSYSILIFLALLGSLNAQQLNRVPRVGFLSGLSASAISTRLEAFRDGLDEAGYREGKNIAIEYRWADGKLNRLPGLAAELARLKPVLIVTSGPPTTRAAKETTNTIPIVMAFD